MITPNTDNRTATIMVRVKPAAVTAIDQLAEADDRTRSSMIRILLTEAVAARQRKDSAR